MAPSSVASHPLPVTHPLDVRNIRSSGRYPNVGFEFFSMLVHLFGKSLLALALFRTLTGNRQGIAITSAMLSRKMVWIIKCPTWPRVLVLVNHTAAWTFFFMISILVDSLGLEISESICMFSVITCVAFYVFSKVTIYLFLAEKVYVVWSVGFRQGSRLRCKAYLVSMLFIFLYSGIAVMLFLERTARFRKDGLCVIGETRISAIINLSYDTFVNVFLTILFVWPLLSDVLTRELRSIAIRSLWASAFALTGSIINIAFLAVMNGRELGWICLSCCAADVMINAATMYWVTTSKCDLSR